MKITIDKTSNIPLYLQVKYLIEKQIVDGSYAAGAAFPTLTEVAKATSVSVRTVQKAFREMEAEGICYRSSS
ncbi:MAG: GntR family transcriptional regulator, partial [Candidatus Pacebacteria bacterium]|nr:GntR family transcriptional regulator [Candidatus Paceibacterota bacterium]